MVLQCYLISKFCSLRLKLLVFIILHFDLQLFLFFLDKEILFNTL